MENWFFEKLEPTKAIQSRKISRALFFFDFTDVFSMFYFLEPNKNIDKIQKIQSTKSLNILDFIDVFFFCLGPFDR